MGEEYDLVVVGAGPAGYVGAIRAAQLGLKTAICEKEHLGGVCLNWGCIPSKALIQQAEYMAARAGLEALGATVDVSGLDYGKAHAKSRQAADRLAKGVAFLLKKNKVQVLEGRAVLAGPLAVEVEGRGVLSARHVLVATGSRPTELPAFPFDETSILSSTGALGLTTLPASLLVLGGGAIGVEFAHVFASFGVAVHVVEMLDSLLPGVDEEAAAVLARAFKKRKIMVHAGARAEGFEKTAEGFDVTITTAKGKVKRIAVEKILVAVGRRPNSEDLGLEAAGVALDRGFVRVGDCYRTDVDSVYAVGDLIATQPLAHVASREAEIAVEHMAGLSPPARIDETEVPIAVYTEPQVAGFGLREHQAAQRGVAFEKSVFPFRGAGKAVATEHPDGLVKILYHPETREILGAHVAGRNASELIHELLLAKRGGLRPAGIAHTIHAHPTLAEAVKEAALGVDGAPIHI